MSDKKSTHTLRINRQKVWTVIRTLNIFTIPMLESKTSMERKSISRYVNDLINAELVAIVDSDEKTGKGSAARVTYKLIKDFGVEHPRFDNSSNIINDDGDINDQLWRTMKMLKDFSINDLAIHASTDRINIKYDAAKRYVSHLNKAGYLVIKRPHKTSGTPAMYRFIPSKDTGSLPPIIEKVKQVYDPNLDKVTFNPRGVRHE